MTVRVQPARPIRVLHVVGSMNRGGVETWLMNVLRNLPHDELAFDFMVHSPKAAAYDDELLALGASRYVCPWPANPLRYTQQFMRILREHGPYDVVHSHVHHFSGFVLLLARLAGVPIRIAHSHNDTTMVQKHSSAPRRFYLNLMERLIHIAATSGIAVSGRAAISLFGPTWKENERWKIIYCGIDVKPFLTYVDKAQVRQELGISKNAFVVGHVGRFDKQKNHGFLIDIFKQLKNNMPDAVLLLIGEGKLKSKIEQKVKDAGLENDVIFTGIREDIPKLMKGAMDVFVFPSLHEGLPITLIEAQMSSLPIIISDTITEESILTNLSEQVSIESSPKDWCVVIEKFAHVDLINNISFAESNFSIDRTMVLLKNEYNR